MAFYGPDDNFASKVVVSFVRDDQSAPDDLKKWHSSSVDVREDRNIARAIAEYFKSHGVAKVVSTGRIIGCPHEEGVDYPEGTKCPSCEYWAVKDRWSGEALQ